MFSILKIVIQIYKMSLILIQMQVGKGQRERVRKNLKLGAQLWAQSHNLLKFLVPCREQTEEGSGDLWYFWLAFELLKKIR